MKESGKHRHRHERVFLTPEIIETLRGHSMRTDIGPMAMLRGAKDKPAGLNSNMISGWLAGSVQKVRKDYIEYILKRWQNLPSVPERVALTDELIAVIERHWLRTGASIRRLVEFSGNAPSDLNARLVRAWLDKSIASARKDHIDFVLGVLEKLPDQRGRITRARLTPLAEERKNRH